MREDWEYDYAFVNVAEFVWPDVYELAHSKRQGWARARRQLAERHKGFQLLMSLQQKQRAITRLLELAKERGAP